MVSILYYWHHRDVRHLFDEEEGNENFEKNEKALLIRALYI